MDNNNTGDNTGVNIPIGDNIGININPYSCASKRNVVELDNDDRNAVSKIYMNTLSKGKNILTSALEKYCQDIHTLIRLNLLDKHEVDNNGLNIIDLVLTSKIPLKRSYSSYSSLYSDRPDNPLQLLNYDLFVGLLRYGIRYNNDVDPINYITQIAYNNILNNELIDMKSQTGFVRTFIQHYIDTPNPIFERLIVALDDFRPCYETLIQTRGSDMFGSTEEPTDMGVITLNNVNKTALQYIIHVNIKSQYMIFPLDVFDKILSMHNINTRDSEHRTIMDYVLIERRSHISSCYHLNELSATGYAKNNVVKAETTYISNQIIDYLTKRGGKFSKTMIKYLDVALINNTFMNNIIQYHSYVLDIVIQTWENVTMIDRMMYLWDNKWNTETTSRGMDYDYDVLKLALDNSTIMITYDCDKYPKAKHLLIDHNTRIYTLFIRAISQFIPIMDLDNIIFSYISGVST